jgi:hypothetical protein
MPNYLLSVVTPTDGTPPGPEAMQKIMADVQRVNQEMQDAGVWVFGGGLHAPDTATMLRPTGGASVEDILVTDGPYAEGKEYLGGLTLISAPDLDAALDWGRRVCRATTLPIEVRPFLDAPPAG